MELASARDLKQVMLNTVLAPLIEGGSIRSFDLSAGPMEEALKPQPSFALGIVQQGMFDYRLAIRYQRPELATSKELVIIRKMAKSEVDVRFIGQVAKLTVPWRQRRHRPLKIGISIGHHLVTAGTLGAFVTRRSDGLPLILSNNHVLANENRGKIGDVIVQPGTYDDGKAPDEVVATLLKFERIRESEPNYIDAAVAILVEGIKFDFKTIRGLGKLAGLGSEILDVGADVSKLGRTTGLTHGRVTAFEMDNVQVGFGLGTLRFDNQLEIEGADDKPFSGGGDSGSLIVDADRRGVGLLFAGSISGGSNGHGLTYANPLRAVLDKLKVDLAF